MRGSSWAPRERFDVACETLEDALQQPWREEIAEGAPRGSADPAAWLRNGMRAHRFRAGGRVIDLSRAVGEMDDATRRDGFHILHAWDPVAHRFREDSAPVLLLTHVRPVVGQNVRRELALQLDTYFLFVLSLLVMRVWDADDPDAAMDRVSALLELLQGPRGSGRWFVVGVPTLLSLAIAQYQPDERGYDELLARVRTLNAHHQLELARVNAANFGAHLRWGARWMYERDMARMQADNVVDYPWVMHSASVLAREYDRLVQAGADASGTTAIAEGLLQILSPDPGALLDDVAPAVLAALEEEHRECRETLFRHKARLIGEFVSLRPVVQKYSPLGFHFNFLHNVLTAVLSLTLSEPTPNLPLNALLMGGVRAARLADSPEVLVHQLTGWASHPSRLDTRRAPLMLHDVAWGAECCDSVIERLRD